MATPNMAQNTYTNLELHTIKCLTTEASIGMYSILHNFLNIPPYDILYWRDESIILDSFNKIEELTGSRPTLYFLANVNKVPRTGIDGFILSLAEAGITITLSLEDGLGEEGDEEKGEETTLEVVFNKDHYTPVVQKILFRLLDKYSLYSRPSTDDFIVQYESRNMGELNIGTLEEFILVNPLFRSQLIAKTEEFEKSPYPINGEFKHNSDSIRD